MNIKTITVIVIIVLCLIPLGIAEHETGYIAPLNPGHITIPTPIAEEYHTGYIDSPHYEINLSNNLSDSGEYSVQSSEYKQSGISEQDNTICLNVQSGTSRTIYNGDGCYLGCYGLGQVGIKLPRDGGVYGHCVRFTVPDEDPFTIGRIGIHARRYGIDGYTRVEIWDDGYVIYSKVIKASEYSSTYWDSWSFIDVPNVIVHNDFYVNICTGSTQDDGVYIAFDGDTGACGSYQSYYNDLYWDLDNHARCDVNWGICAVETADTPGYDEGYEAGHAAGITEALLNEVIGDVTGDDKVNIGDAVLLFNWVAYPNERGTTYILR